jgi:hypothetical protein
MAFFPVKLGWKSIPLAGVEMAISFQSKLTIRAEFKAWALLAF